MSVDESTDMLVPRERRRYEAVVESVLELVESRGLKPNDALPTERELSELFGVSRNVLRQAFSVLEERGMLRTIRGSGRYLRSVQGSVGSSSRAQIEVASIADLLEARKLLEVQIAELACERRTAQQAQSLPILASRLSAWEDNVRFHCALAACTHNFVLERMVRQQMDLAGELHQREHYQDPAHLERMRSEHQAIAAAVAARDRIQVGELIRTHLDGTRREVAGAPE